jgi:4-hydroxybenzoyl-CoA reductase subunit alpha
MDDDALQALVDREFALIGSRMVRVDGLDKSTGRAVYTDDIALPGMLHGKILRSPHAHARILSIDTSEAEAMEGVTAVITGRDLPTEYCIIPWTRDETALCVDRVRFIGDGVAAVAAVDEDTANRALDAIRVLYEPLPAFFDPRDALDPGRRRGAVHAPKKEGWNGNITKMVDLTFGEVDRELAESETVVDGDYYFEGTTHAPIEPHCAIGYMDPGASSPSGRPPRCPTTCTGSWPGSSTWTWPGSAWCSRRSAARSAGSRSRSTWSSASPSWPAGRVVP